MKKLAIFAASAAVLVGGSMMPQAANAAEAGHINKGSANEVLVNALYDKATITQREGSVALVKSIGQDGKDIGGDFTTVTKIVFDCSDGNPLAGATDWRGLSYFTNLIEIKLCDAEGVDWSELAEISTLKDVLISNGSASGVPEDYFLNGGSAVDLSGIEGLTNLQTLTIYGVPIYDLSHIEDLQNLENLYLEYDGLTDVSGLQKLSGLRNFAFGYNTIQDVTPIAIKLGIQGDSNSDINRQVIEQSTPYIQNNTWYISTTKNTPYVFTGDLDFLNDYLFDSTKVERTSGVVLDNDAKTVVVTDDMGQIVFKNNGLRYSYILKFITNDSSDDAEEKTDGSDNPDTGDTFNLGWAMGIAAAILATGSFVIRSRR